MAAESARDIKRRIRSVQNTQQITKAMEMVAGAKLRRVQQRVLEGRPFAATLREVLARLVASLQSEAGGKASVTHPLLTPREVRRVCYVVIAGDRGLAGGYNSQVIRFGQRLIDEETRPAHLVAVGRKAVDYFTRRGYETLETFVQLGDDVDHAASQVIAQTLTRLYSEERVDEINLVYNPFTSPGSYRPVVERFLPLAHDEALQEAADEEMEAESHDGADQVEAAEEAWADEERAEYVYEPSKERVLDILVPRYAETLIFRALLEAKACEHGARMVAMRNASDNAQEMIGELTLRFNRARQAGITAELTEIVAGVNALSGNA